MKRIDNNVVWGVLLIAAGVLFFMQSFGYIGTGTAWEMVWGLLFGLVGLAFTWRYLSDRTRSWWAVIPGFTLLALSVLIGFNSLGFGNTENEGAWFGALFLGAIGLAFWTVYLTRREFWWAVIPGGVLFTLAFIALVSQWSKGEVIGAIFFFGLAITFGLVYMLPTPHGRMTWALIPASVLALLGLTVLLAFTTAVNYIWAVGLILAGLYLLFRQRSGGAGQITRQG